MLDAAQAHDYVRRFDGVSADVLADGAWLLQRPAFWLSLVDGCAEPDLIEALFGGTGDSLNDLNDAIMRSGRWPVLRIQAGRADIAVVYWHGFDGEGGYDFLVLPATDARCLRVASVDGYGPGLSWPELDRLVKRGVLGTTAQRLMLLLPALGDADTPDHTIDMVAAALRDLGDRQCDPAIASHAAAQILESPVHWTRYDNALVCDGEHALRTSGACQKLISSSSRTAWQPRPG